MTIFERMVDLGALNAGGGGTTIGPMEARLTMTKGKKNKYYSIGITLGKKLAATVGITDASRVNVFTSDTGIGILEATNGKYCVRKPGKMSKHNTLKISVNNKPGSGLRDRRIKAQTVEYQLVANGILLTLPESVVAA